MGPVCALRGDGAGQHVFRKTARPIFTYLHDDPRTMAETTSQAFLGMSVQCAKCHNHPMEKWTNDQYYKLANLFARVRTKNGSGDGDNIVFVSNTGDLVQPLTGKPQPPTPLDGTPLPLESEEDRRQHLADWLVSRDNRHLFQPAPSSIASGKIFTAWAWWKMWTICA